MRSPWMENLKRRSPPSQENRWPVAAVVSPAAVADRYRCVKK